MYVLNVEGMSCGHCVASVSKAILAVDPGAAVDVDLAAGLARIEGDQANAAQVAAAVSAAGFPAVLAV